MSALGKSLRKSIRNLVSQTSSTSAASAKRKLRKSRALAVESLEGRALMAADVVFDSSQYATDRLLVQLRPEFAQTSIAQAVSGISSVSSIGESGWLQLNLQVGANLNGAMQRLQQLSSVLTVTPDFRVNLTSVPNDPMYASQWSLTGSTNTSGNIGATQAWDYGTGSNTIIVGVIDTGIDYTHPDLAANIWTNTREIAGNGIDDDGNGYRDDIRGWNFVANNNNPMDDNSHGTHVAGTIGAVGNNGVGVTGVAWNVKLMPLKFMDASGGGYLSDAVRAVDYARVNGAKIINASFGGGGFSSAMQSALSRFQQAGGIFVAAAGNEASNNAVVASYPANYELTNVISVAASTSTGALASFSNFGTNVDIAAPGQNILSTIPGGKYGSMSGTSMAAPHVAGALALLWGQSPTATATQLINAVYSNTDAVLTSRTIYGKLNVGKAAAALKGSSTTTGDTVAPYVESAQWVSNASAIDSVILDFSEEMNVSSVASAITVTGPSGAVVVSSVQKSSTDATKVVVKLTSAQTAGSYRIDLSAEARDLAGNKLNQDRDATFGETTQDKYFSQMSLVPSSVTTYSSAQNVPIADATARRSTITNIPIDIADSRTIASMSVELSVNHTYVSDLRVRLISPTGTAVTLVNRRGGSSDNMRLTLSDSAASSIAIVNGVLTGTFRGEQALSAFAGQNTKGRWTIEITDFATADVGTLNSAKLIVTPSTTTSSSAINSGNQSQGSSSAAMGALWQLMDVLFRRRF